MAIPGSAPRCLLAIPRNGGWPARKGEPALGRSQPYDQRDDSRRSRLQPRMDIPRRLLDRTPAPLLVIGAALSVQCGAALATTLFEEAGALGAVWLRQAFGAAILIALSRGALRRLRGRPLAPVLALGAILAVMNSLFYASIDRVPLGSPSPRSSWARSSWRRSGLVASRTSFGSRSPGQAWRSWEARASTSTTSGSCSRWARADAGPSTSWSASGSPRPGRSWTGLTVAMLVAAVLIAPFGVASAGSQLSGPSLLAIGIVVALLASVIPYLLELSALRRIKVSAFGILMSLEPAAAALAGAVILSQRLTLLESVAIVLVIVASIGANRRAAAVPPRPD